MQLERQETAVCQLPQKSDHFSIMSHKAILLYKTVFRHGSEIFLQNETAERTSFKGADFSARGIQSSFSKIVKLLT